MDMVNLSNGLTVWLSEIRHQFWPQGRFVILFTLCPTTGVEYTPSLDLLKSWNIQWDEQLDAGIISLFLGANSVDIKNALVGQYESFSNSGAYDHHLRELFKYISEVGISQ